MSIFDFGKKQRLHTQLVGNTSGSEMFKIEEYQKTKKILFGIGIADFMSFAIFFFSIQDIPLKITIFWIISLIALNAYGYYTFKHYKKIKQRLI